MTAQAGSAAPLSFSALDSADRKLIRKSMRSQRAALSSAQRKSVARAIAIHLDRTLPLRPGKRIAVYLAVRGEVSLEPFIRKAQRRRCELFIPRITNFRQA